MGFAELPIKYLNFNKELERLAAVGGSFSWFALRFPDLSKKCSCAGKGIMDSPPSCRRCFDTGYLFQDQLIKCYTWTAVLGVEYATPAGPIATQVRNFLVESDRNLSRLAYLLELEIDKGTGMPIQPFRISKTFKIQDFWLVKARDNKPAFWKVSAEERGFSNNKGADDGTNYNHGVMA